MTRPVPATVEDPSADNEELVSGALEKPPRDRCPVRALYLLGVVAKLDQLPGLSLKDATSRQLWRVRLHRSIRSKPQRQNEHQEVTGWP